IKVDMLRKRREAKTRMEEAFKDAPAAGALLGAEGGGAPKPQGGPPNLKGDAGMMRIRALAREAEARQTTAEGMRLAQVEAMQDKAQNQLAQLYQKAAHHQPPAGQALGGRSVRMRRRVQSLMQ